MAPSIPCRQRAQAARADYAVGRSATEIRQGMSIIPSMDPNGIRWTEGTELSRSECRRRIVGCAVVCLLLVSSESDWGRSRTSPTGLLRFDGAACP